MVRIISIRYEDGYVTSILFDSLNTEDIVNKFLSMEEEFDERRVIYPDLSERVWTDEFIEKYNEEEE